MAKRVIHLGNAGKAGIDCGAPERRTLFAGLWDRNWAWSPEAVTCKRCLAIYRKRVAETTPTKARKS